MIAVLLLENLKNKKCKWHTNKLNAEGNRDKTRTRFIRYVRSRVWVYSKWRWIFRKYHRYRSNDVRGPSRALLNELSYRSITRVTLDRPFEDQSTNGEYRCCCCLNRICVSYGPKKKDIGNLHLSLSSSPPLVRSSIIYSISELLKIQDVLKSTDEWSRNELGKWISKVLKLSLGLSTTL